MTVSCSICFDDITSSDPTHGTSCGHVFHSNCLLDWVKRSRTCPQCRRSVVERNICRVYLNFSDQNQVLETAMAHHQTEVDELEAKLIDRNNVIAKLKKQEAGLNSLLKVRDTELKTAVSRLKYHLSVERHQKDKITTLTDRVEVLHKQVVHATVEIHNLRSELEATKIRAVRLENSKNMTSLRGVMEECMSNCERMKLDLDAKMMQLKRTMGTIDHLVNPSKTDKQEPKTRQRRTILTAKENTEPLRTSSRSLNPNRESISRSQHYNLRPR